MLRLLFICQCKPVQTKAQVRLVQRDVWRRCENKKFGGFLVRKGHFLIGLFEATPKNAIGQVEHMIRKHGVQSVHVVRETPIEKREWTTWCSQYERLEDVPHSDTLNLAGLAQNIMDAVEASESIT